MFVSSSDKKIGKVGLLVVRMNPDSYFFFAWTITCMRRGNVTGLYTCIHTYMYTYPSV